VRQIARLLFAALCVVLILLTFVLDHSSDIGRALTGH
jgi:hypothetical protein